MWSYPQDKHVEVGDYMHGDWRTNGRGDHEVSGPNGTMLIKLAMPLSEKVYTRQRRLIDQVMKTTVVADNTQDLVDGENMANIFQNVAQAMGNDGSTLVVGPSGASGSGNSLGGAGSEAPQTPQALAEPRLLKQHTPSPQAQATSATPTVPKIKKTAPFIHCGHSYRALATQVHTCTMLDVWISEGVVGNIT